MNTIYIYIHIFDFDRNRSVYIRRTFGTFIHLVLMVKKVKKSRQQQCCQTIYGWSQWSVYMAGHLKAWDFRISQTCNSPAVSGFSWSKHRAAIDFDVAFPLEKLDNPASSWFEHAGDLRYTRVNLSLLKKMTYMYYTCRYVIIQLYMLKKGMLADLTIPLFAELDTSPSWIRWICCVVWNCESLNSAFPTFFNWKMATISKAKAAARK